MGEPFQSERWMELYRSTMLELEDSKMLGRIEATRTEIIARVAKLDTMPGLHSEEREAITDALSALRVLEREHARQDAEVKRERIAHDDSSSPSEGR